MNGVAVVACGQAYPVLGSRESAPVSHHKKPTTSNRDGSTERRGQARGAGGGADWETIVLKRVERHVESLSPDPAAIQGVAHEASWEDAALLALRRRLRDLKAE